jgi:hypothetical protein
MPPVVVPHHTEVTRRTFGVTGLLIAVTLLAVTALALKGLISRPSINRLESRVNRLTYVGTVRLAAVSLDGRTVAYVRGEGVRESLWLMKADDPVPVRLLEPVDGTFRTLSFAPDDSIHYTLHRPDKTVVEPFRLSMRDGPPEALNDPAGGIAFRADGSQYAYVSTFSLTPREPDRGHGLDQQLAENSRRAPAPSQLRANETRLVAGRLTARGVRRERVGARGSRGPRDRRQRWSGAQQHADRSRRCGWRAVARQRDPRHLRPAADRSASASLALVPAVENVATAHDRSQRLRARRTEPERTPDRGGPGRGRTQHLGSQRERRRRGPPGRPGFR